MHVGYGSLGGEVEKEIVACCTVYSVCYSKFTGVHAMNKKLMLLALSAIAAGTAGVSLCADKTDLEKAQDAMKKAQNDLTLVETVKAIGDNDMIRDLGWEGKTTDGKKDVIEVAIDRAQKDVVDAQKELDKQMGSESWFSGEKSTLRRGLRTVLATCTNPLNNIKGLSGLNAKHPILVQGTVVGFGAAALAYAFGDRAMKMVNGADDEEDAPEAA